MLNHRISLALCTGLMMTSIWAVPTAQQPATAATPTTSPAPQQNPPLRQPGTAAPITDIPTAISKMQQMHKQELVQQQKRLQQLEQANQQALAQNQTLQLKNDNLTVQVQVLQSERSAQMFLYGAATIAIGVFIGIIIYHLLYTRRRRKW
ncbi:hypothetical protein F4V57_11325 [Acinetobacter qingfengensis]|uniref:SH3 domain protein n=1 Tax=Acinetobacter qingfengensis TaxID=1262585 RepID=A0A1E7RFW4_9GAMM|nr:hypothetical protein [Acinetobacter qingfengensis]KAA8731832.1 hypothetical protein F4V57_11325 [Acinetobacter qingfengensis]OEY98045.1 hypothetical protein BJI46_00500 [Acinetobacter qingfengensis]